MASFDLADFDPAIHVKITRSSEPFCTITIATSDGTEKVESEFDMNDVTKMKRKLPDVRLFWDSIESANRLAEALAQAISL